MLFPKSIRWRLPLSYGAVALVAALSLGLVLLLMLRTYYTSQEVRYLERNAAAIAQSIGEIAPQSANNPLLQTQLNTFAFLTDTQIRVFSAENQLIADSGHPSFLTATDNLTFNIAQNSDVQQFSQTINNEPDGAIRTITTLSDGSQVIRTETSIRGSASDETLPLTSLVNPYQFTLGGSADKTERTTAIVKQPLEVSFYKSAGYLELSQGPAFGQAIIRTVLGGLVAASLIATLLATALGGWLSRRLTEPLDRLTAATTQMAAGDLTTRINLKREDEFGRLGHSFNHMAERVDDTVTTLRRFAADAAHELNTPLTALRTNLELALPLSATPHYIQQADAQAERLQHLSADLLHLSQLESKTTLPQHTKLDLCQLIAQATEPLASRAEQADIDCSFDLPNEPIFIKGDAPQITRAYENLLDNAIKFTPSGGKISVKLLHHGTQASLIVSDSGIGLSGDLSYLFERFHRAPNATSYPGSGLGLAIVQQIVVAHGGVVSAESNPKGATFTVQLPLSGDSYAYFDASASA